MNDKLAEAARGAIQAMADWGLDFHSAYGALVMALHEHDERVVDEAKSVAASAEVM